MKKIALVKLAFVSVIFACLLVGSCGNLFPTKIGDIQGNPRKYSHKEVTVSGEVIEVLSLIAFRYFIIRDNTGEITVITSRTLPAVGQKLTVHGIVKEAFAIGNQNMLVIMEDPPKAR
ncbi:MAG: hypothetical protein ACYDHW_09950 [Syntrophorhabdaceae bacterium]